jgi:hypothetical protein
MTKDTNDRKKIALLAAIVAQQGYFNKFFVLTIVLL